MQVTIRFDDGTVVMFCGTGLDEQDEDISIAALDHADDLFLDDDNYHLFLGGLLFWVPLSNQCQSIMDHAEVVVTERDGIGGGMIYSSQYIVTLRLPAILNTSSAMLP